jgi:hypothetical protein
MQRQQSWKKLNSRNKSHHKYFKEIKMKKIILGITAIIISISAFAQVD